MDGAWSDELCSDHERVTRRSGFAVKSAVIKAFEGLGSEEPDSYASSDPENDAFTLRMLVGSLDTPGLESFDVLVCTPGWLATEVREHGPQIGRHLLIMDVLDLGRAQAFLKERVERISAPTWLEVAERVARLGYWELEDYSG